MPPYELPKHKTRSTFKTNTHKGKGFNELRFEDEAGQEEIYTHAERDQVLYVKNHRVKQILGSQVESVAGNKQIEVAKSHSETVDGNMDIKVGVNFMGGLAVGLSKIFGKSSDRLSSVLKAKAYRLARFGKPTTGLGNYQLQVSGSKVEYVGKISSENIGAAKSSVVAGERIDATGQNHRTRVGANSINQVGKFYTIDAADGWQMTTGSSSIVCLADGTISIRGKNIAIHGDDTVKITGGRIDLN